jgi:hypothetical protein
VIDFASRCELEDVTLHIICVCFGVLIDSRKSRKDVYIVFSKVRFELFF